MKIHELTESEAPSKLAQAQAAFAPQADAPVVEPAAQPTGVKKGSVEASLVRQGSLPKMGKYLRDQYKDEGFGSEKLKSTGSREVDDLLRSMGFKPQ